MRALVLAVLLVVAPPAQERPLPDFNTLAAEVKKHLATDEERQSGYVFNERRVEQKVNVAGRVTDESVKVYEVYPGLPGENRYRRLIEEDGRSTHHPTGWRSRTPRSVAAARRRGSYAELTLATDEGYGLSQQNS